MSPSRTRDLRRAAAPLTAAALVLGISANPDPMRAGAPPSGLVKQITE